MSTKPDITNARSLQRRIPEKEKENERITHNCRKRSRSQSSPTRPPQLSKRQRLDEAAHSEVTKLFLEGKLDFHKLSNDDDHLSPAEAVAKIKEQIEAEAKLKAEKEGEEKEGDDELCLAEESVRNKIIAWKRKARLPDKYEKSHECMGGYTGGCCRFKHFGSNAYVCRETGIVHVCEGSPCSKATLISDYNYSSSLVCTLSSRSFCYIVQSPSRPRHKLEDDEDEEAGDSDYGNDPDENPNDRDNSESRICVSVSVRGRAEKGGCDRRKCF